MTDTGYTPVCVLRRCGQLEGPAECCAQIHEAGLDKLVLESILQHISRETCAQFYEGRCITRFSCRDVQSYCYPVPLAWKRPNRVVAVMFAWYCADVAEDAACAAKGAARAAAYAAARAACAADAAADAAYAAERAAAYAAKRDNFYLDASREIEKLVNAWGTPIEEDGPQ